MSKVRNDSLPQIIEYTSKSLTYTPFAVKWVPCSARVVALGSHPRGSGALQVYQMEQGQLKLLHESEKKSGIKCGTFGASAFEERHLATGDYNGILNIWDLERLDTPLFSVKAHSSLINTIDGCGGLNIGNGAREIVTGGHDGCVRLWDPRQQDVITSLEPESGQTVRDCWAVAFGNSYNDEERCVCAGYDNGDIKLLDLKMNKIRWETNAKNGIVSIQFDRKDIQMNKIIVTCLESKFHVYDMRTFHQEEGYASLAQKAHNSTVWQAIHTPQNRDLFATSGGNGSVNVYKYIYPDQRSLKDVNGVERGVAGSVELLCSRKMSEQPVVCLDWSADKLGLCAMACLDQTIKVAVVTKLNS